jgi:CheY-like chemotaxis protein
MLAATQLRGHAPIKANPAMRSIPMIAVTARALDGEEQTARAAGCDGYVPDPNSPRQLLAKTRQCMPRWHQASRLIKASLAMQIRASA